MGDRSRTRNGSQQTSIQEIPDLDGRIEGSGNELQRIKRIDEVGGYGGGMTSGSGGGGEGRDRLGGEGGVDSDRGGEGEEKMTVKRTNERRGKKEK